MNRIEQRFNSLREQHLSAFIPFLTAGDPNLAQTEHFIYALEAAGADIIELGVPFSDPVGDGAAIQEAAQRALAQGATLPSIFESVKRVRKHSDVPILLFTYFNPILAHGIDAFAQHAAEAGVDGVLCVDLPPEEAGEYKAALDAQGLCTVFLVAPTSTDERIAAIAGKCSGFVYYVSQMGVTGARAELAAGIGAAIERIHRHTAKPVAVGFGISTPEQARKVAGLAEGVVVGSAIVRLIAQCGASPDAAENVGQFARQLAEAIQPAREP